MFLNAAPVPPGTHWVTLPALDHRPVTVTVTRPGGARERLPGVCTAWSTDRALALVDVHVGTERYPTVLRVADVEERAHPDVEPD